jgi:hypothetical protein
MGHFIKKKINQTEYIKIKNIESNFEPNPVLKYVFWKILVFFFDSSSLIAIWIIIGNFHSSARPTLASQPNKF